MRKNQTTHSHHHGPQICEVIKENNCSTASNYCGECSNFLILAAGSMLLPSLTRYFMSSATTNTLMLLPRVRYFCLRLMVSGNPKLAGNPMRLPTSLGEKYRNCRWWRHVRTFCWSCSSADVPGSRAESFHRCSWLKVSSVWTGKRNDICLVKKKICCDFFFSFLQGITSHVTYIAIFVHL